MHLRAYTLQTVFFYPGKSWYGKTLLSPNAKLFLPLAMGKVLSFEIPGNIYFLFANGKIFPIGNEWNVTDIFTSKDSNFCHFNFCQSRKTPLFLQLFKLFHLVPLDLYCFGDPTTTVRVIQENRKGFLFFPIFQEWTKSFCFYGLLNTFGIPGKNKIINYWKIMFVERQHHSHLIERLLTCF